MRRFNDSLAGGADLLAGERQELAAVLRNLSVAMVQVRGFVKENRGSLTRNIAGLNRISKVLVKRRDALDKTLRVRAGGAEQPVPRRQRQAGHPGHPRQRRRAPRARSRTTRLTALCTLVEQATPTATSIEDALGAGAPRPGSRSPATPPPKPRVPEPIDRSLGGLVEVTR